jgi:signal transduction histidine kinase
MIHERQMGDKIEDYDVIINRSLERIKGMRTLILDLLDLTKVELGKGKRSIAPVNLNQIARTAMDTMRPYAIQREIKMTLFGSEDLTINADSDEIEIIFNNLISNAIKYNKEGGTVECTISKENDHAAIKVVDTGIGISKEDLEKIFDDFVRIKNEKTKSISGTGLGLAIVKKMTENYNGTIEVSSLPDKGSTFIIKLPINTICS